MSITVTCPTCAQQHAVVPGIAKAHPGEEYGGRWFSAGPSAPLTLTRLSLGATMATYTWTCVCGAGLVYELPATEAVRCTYQEPTPGAGCRVHARRTAPPADVHSNPRHGAACPCCGQQGLHLVRVDRADVDALPSCLRATSPGA